MQARVASVNVGRPREIAVDGKLVRTSIWKDLVAGRVAVRGVNLNGDAYLRIVEEGEIGAGDAVRDVSRRDDAPSMGAVMRGKTKRSE